jgi:hypothetical protein
MKGWKRPTAIYPYKKWVFSLVEDRIIKKEYRAVFQRSEEPSRPIKWPFIFLSEVFRAKHVKMAVPLEMPIEPPGHGEPEFEGFIPREILARPVFI